MNTKPCRVCGKPFSKGPTESSTTFLARHACSQRCGQDYRKVFGATTRDASHPVTLALNALQAAMTSWRRPDPEVSSEV